MCHTSLSVHPSMMNLSAGKQWRSRYGEQNCGHSGGSREWDGWREWQGNMNITMRKVTASGDFSYDSGNSNQCPVSTWRGGVEWEVRQRFKTEGMYVSLCLIHVDRWQKPTQYCKEIILQFKRKKRSGHVLWQRRYSNLWLIFMGKQREKTFAV